MINYSQALAYIIMPALEALGLASFKTLLTGTFAKESNSGTYISQLGGGPALGVFQMEPVTHDDIWRIYLPNQPLLTLHLMTVCGLSRIPAASMLRINLLYAACMCAILYKWRLEQYKKPTPITPLECADIWKLCYNTTKGRGTTEQWLDAYSKYVASGETKTSAKAPKAPTA